MRRVSRTARTFIGGGNAVFGRERALSRGSGRLRGQACLDRSEGDTSSNGSLSSSRSSSEDLGLFLLCNLSLIAEEENCDRSVRS